MIEAYRFRRFRSGDTTYTFSVEGMVPEEDAKGLAGSLTAAFVALRTMPSLLFEGM